MATSIGPPAPGIGRATAAGAGCLQGLLACTKQQPARSLVEGGSASFAESADRRSTVAQGTVPANPAPDGNQLAREHRAVVIFRYEGFGLMPELAMLGRNQ